MQTDNVIRTHTQPLMDPAVNSLVILKHSILQGSCNFRRRNHHLLRSGKYTKGRISKILHHPNITYLLWPSISYILSLYWYVFHLPYPTFTSVSSSILFIFYTPEFYGNFSVLIEGHLFLILNDTWVFFCGPARWSLPILQLTHLWGEMKLKLVYLLSMYCQLLLPYLQTK